MNSKLQVLFMISALFLSFTAKAEWVPESASNAGYGTTDWLSYGPWSTWAEARSRRIELVPGKQGDSGRLKLYDRSSPKCSTFVRGYFHNAVSRQREFFRQ